MQQKAADGAAATAVFFFGLSLADVVLMLQAAALVVSIVAGVVSLYFRFRKRK